MSAMDALVALLFFCAVFPTRATPPSPPASPFGTFAQFDRWFREAGGEARSIDLNASGVFATSFVARGDRVLSVPRRVIMCRETLVARGTMGRESFKRIKRDDDLLTVALLLEEAKLQQHWDDPDLAPGRWADYVSVLPLKTMLLPIFFTKAELEELQDADLVARIRDQRAALEKRYKKLRTILKQLFRANGFSKAAQQEMASLERFLRAASLVGSRALTLRGSRFLVPYVDMIRFAPRPVPHPARWFRRPPRAARAGAANTAVRAWPWQSAAQGEALAASAAASAEAEKEESNAGDRFLQYHTWEQRGGEEGGEVFSVYADRDTQRGEALLEDYGEHRNEIYFMHHAFVPRPRSNPSNCVQVPLPSIAAALWERLRLGPSHAARDLVNTVRGYERAIAAMQRDPESTPSEVAHAIERVVAANAKPSGRADLAAILATPAVTISPCITTTPAEHGVARATGLPQLMPYLRLSTAAERDLTRVVAPPPGGAGAEAYTREQLRAMSTALEPWAAHNAGAQRVARDRAWTARAFSHLRTAVLARLGMYPTTLREDERQWRAQRRLRADAAAAAARAASAGEGNASSHGGGSGGALVSRSTFLALRFRIAQKTTLRDALLWLGRASDSSGANGGDARSVLSEGDCDCSRAPTLAAAAAALENWLEVSGAYTEPVRSVMVGQGMRLGLVTQRDVAVNDTIIAVPLRLVMDAASARSVPKIATVLDDLNVRYPDADDTPHALLYLLLHEARVVGDASQWVHYLRTLPTERDLRQALPAFFDESLIAELEPSELAADIRRYQAHLRASFALVRERVFARFPAVFPPAKCNFDAYRWAHLVLDTRATWWGGEVHLLPMRDFVNTRERITTDRDDRVWGVRSAVEDVVPLPTPTVETIEGEEYAVVRSAMRFPTGRQLFESLDASNHDLFLFHGLAPPRSGEVSPTDCVRMTFSLDEAAAEAVAEKKGSKRGDVGGAVSVDVGVGGGAGSAEEGDAAQRDELAAKFVAAAKMQQLRSIGIFAKRRTFCIRPGAPAPSLLTFLRVVYDIGATDTSGALRKLVELCRKRVALYPTTVAEDRAELERLSWGNRRFGVVRFRMKEKAMLQNAIQSLVEIIHDVEQSALMDGLIKEMAS